MGSNPQLEDVPELMQHIQLWLPVKEAARTSVLSKSWLHAWSTIPTLRFHVRGRKDIKLADMDRILIRYLQDNIPIENFDLDVDIEDQESASLVEKCIRTMATKTCTLKELSLSFHLNGASFNLPDEIFSCENLTTLRVLNEFGLKYTSSLRMTRNHPVLPINCVSLLEVDLCHVNISQELLDGILSSCRLLMRIQLIFCSKGLNTIKVKNLPFLYELRIFTEDGGSTALEIDHVPNLRLFTCNLYFQERKHHVPFDDHAISLGSSLVELSLIGVVIDHASLDMFQWRLPFLMILTLDLQSWKLECFRFTCASIKILSLQFCRRRLTDVKVYAPNLQIFSFDGKTMPTSLQLPISTMIKHTEFRLRLVKPLDVSFFLNMRKALAISSNCHVHIINSIHDPVNHGPLPLNINIDDLRARLPFPPAVKVKRLSFGMMGDEDMSERSTFFDAFFEICHPNHVTAMQNLGIAPKIQNHFCKVMLREVLEKKNTATVCWPRYLKHVQIRHHDIWETLTDSHKSFLDGSTPDLQVHFKLEWR